MIALLLDREFNHSRKCLEVPIRKKLDWRNIYGVYSITLYPVFLQKIANLQPIKITEISAKLHTTVFETHQYTKIAKIQQKVHMYECFCDPEMYQNC